MYDHAFMSSCLIVARLINVELTFKAMAHQPTQPNCSVVRAQAAFHMGPGWAPIGQSWAPFGPRLGLSGAHLGMLLGGA